MKHRITTLLLVLPLLFASCSKDYFSELRHPLEIQGEFDPVYGFPLAKMSADIGTIVGMLDTNQDITVYIREDDVVSFRYDYTNHAVLSWTNEPDKRHADRSKGVFDTIYSYSVIEGTQRFDIFEKLQYFDTNSFNVNEFLITVDADVQGFVNSAFEASVDAGVNLTFDSLVIVINCMDGYSKLLPMLISTEEVSVTELLHSRHIPIFDQYDFRDVVEHKPISVDYTVRMCLSMPFDQMLPNSTFQENMESLGVDSIVADIQARLELPLSFYSNNISYVDTVDLDLSNLEEQLSNIENDTLTGEHYTVCLNDESCFLAFVVNNGLPIGLRFDVTFLDEYNTPILSTLFQGDYEMYSSPVMPMPGHPNTYISNGTTSSQFKLQLTLNKLKQLGRCRRMIYDINLNSARSGNKAGRDYVAIRKDDRLDIRTYVVLSPHADFTLPVELPHIPFLNN
ncbi:MAG: hypothetical protein IKG81_00850 [Bacteroidales bacterium]|nr:hypothetical protein [Bacteroidales bacterium]